MTYIVARFRDAPPWHPTSCVPPGVPRSPNPPSSDDEPPTSLGRGEGRAGILAADAGHRVHIPRQRGEANCGV